MSTYETFKTDEELEKKGIEIDFGDTGCFLVARAGGANQRFKKASEKKFRPYRRQIESGTIDPKVANRLMVEVFAESVILDWQNVTDENGEEMACTYDNVVKLFTDLPDLFSEIQQEAMKFANYKAMEVEEDLKNSEQS